MKNNLPHYVDVNDVDALHSFLGVNFKRIAGSAWISQGNCFTHILKRFRMDKRKKKVTSICEGSPRVFAEEGRSLLDQTRY